MKTFLLLLVLCLGAFLAGCGLVTSEEEHNQQIKGITDLQARQMVDDWDYIWLYERNSRMTYWHPRLGY